MLCTTELFDHLIFIHYIHFINILVNDILMCIPSCRCIFKSVNQCGNYQQYIKVYTKHIFFFQCVSLCYTVQGQHLLPGSVCFRLCILPYIVQKTDRGGGPQTQYTEYKIINFVSILT